MEVSEHGVGAPASDEANGVGVDADAAAEQGHGTPSAQAAGIDVVRGEAEVREAAHGGAQQDGDVSGCDVGGCAVEVDGAKGCVGRGVV